MAGESLRTSEIAVLFALLAEAQEISNVDLKERYGFTLTGESKRHLNDRKLVVSRRVGRAFVHELTDLGWARCREELTASCPPRSGTAGGALYAVLHGLHRYLQRADLSLPEIFGRRAARPPADAEAEIRAAYATAPRRPGGWVALTDLRPLLAHIPRQTIDDTIVRMSRLPRVSILPEENQKVLTQPDRDAAVSMGGRSYHFLLIEDA
jgi:hypothetical protein